MEAKTFNADMIRNTWDGFICKAHSGKMTGLQSFSTNCLDNSLCKARALDPSTICSHCFAATQIKRYKNQSTKLSNATAFITKAIYPLEAVPIVSTQLFRLEAFGDLLPGVRGQRQIANYVNMCIKNPKVNFALWTKNPEFLNTYFKAGHKKPDNLIIVFSSYFLNAAAVVPGKYWFLDKVFNVYTKAYAETNNIIVNCGARSCLNCQRCYHSETETIINEILK